MQALSDSLNGDPALEVIRARSPAETERLGRALARRLQKQDVVCLFGELGAGKSHLARAIIRARVGDPALDVPSPSYTLANVYETPDRTEIWHVDLYRINAAEDLDEIGLSDAIGHALILVEWPGLWVDRPADCVDVTLLAEDDLCRRILIAWPEGHLGRPEC